MKRLMTIAPADEVGKIAAAAKRDSSLTTYYDSTFDLSGRCRTILRIKTTRAVLPPELTHVITAVCPAGSYEFYNDVPPRWAPRAPHPAVRIRVR